MIMECIGRAHKVSALPFWRILTEECPHLLMYHLSVLSDFFFLSVLVKTSVLILLKFEHRVESKESTSL